MNVPLESLKSRLGGRRWQWGALWRGSGWWGRLGRRLRVLGYFRRLPSIYTVLDFRRLPSVSLFCDESISFRTKKTTVDFRRFTSFWTTVDYRRAPPSLPASPAPPIAPPGPCLGWPGPAGAALAPPLAAPAAKTSSRTTL